MQHKYTHSPRKSNCTCKTCGRAFYTTPARIRDGRGVYCSRACRYVPTRNRPIVDNGDGTATVHLSGGKTALIDVSDIDRVHGKAWAVAGRGYVIEPTGEKMHRLIMDAPDGVEVDHVNHNPLDNRRANLRLCTSAENKWNTRRFITNTTGYKGVSFDKTRGTYRAYITVNDRQVHLGRFDCAEDAARAYDAAARNLRGDFARLNFPDD